MTLRAHAYAGTSRCNVHCRAQRAQRDRNISTTTARIHARPRQYDHAMPALRTIANSISTVYKTRISTPTAGCVLVRRGFSSTPRTGFTETSWRGFTETKRWGMKHPREEMKSHYETLGIPEGASRADIKKRFYALSKTHHPDLNRNDPEASKKFISISNAYSILGNPKLREKYDKELFRARPASHASPVGARPASGLSRRRTQPMGPPPSFYRNGAWNTMKSSSTTGSYGSAQARATAQAASEAWAKGHAAANQATGGGMGYTAGHGAGAGRVHGFNFEGKVRQHERQEERVRLRGKKNATGDRKVVVPFLVVSGILALSVWVSGIGREKGTKAAIQGGEVWNR